MKTLILLRGIPASGKSHFIKEYNLESYTISPDSLRVMVQSPILTPSGTQSINQNNDAKVWKMLFEILESRMQNGDLTIIDATHTKNSALRQYDELCERYRYRVVVVDFSDISPDVAISRDKDRGFKAVGESIIQKMHKNLMESRTQKLPARYKIIKPDEIDSIWLKPLDLSNYRRIHHIGDIHGSYSALVNYLCYQHKGDFDGSNLANLLNDDEYYIFVGDYLDRGVENAKVFRLMYEIMDLPNVCLIEGNHERWLKKWGEGESVSKEFKLHTQKDLEQNNISQKDARNFYRKLRQCSFYRFCDKIVFISHGGISKMPKMRENNRNKIIDEIFSPSLIATRQIIYGTGDYEDLEESAKRWDTSMPNNFYQVFGHRNREKFPILLHNKSLVLEGGVEFGGDLRIAVLSQDTTIMPNSCIENLAKMQITAESYQNNWSGVYVKNSIHSDKIAYKHSQNLLKIIADMQKSPYIRERVFENGRISSFNFTKEAFFKKRWNTLTCKARGLFIDNECNKIIARSYDKFFNLNERPETSLESLHSSLVYPLRVFVKENGFLGILSVYDDKLFATSKSDLNSDYSQIFKKILDSTMPQGTQTKLIDLLKYENLSLVFEVIEPIFDPHIIKYSGEQIILLDAIKNTIEFEKLPYSELCEIANKFGLKVKNFAKEIKSNDELDEFLSITKGAYRYDDNGVLREIEGFVIEDSDKFMFKVKLDFYNTWKFLRQILEKSVRDGKVTLKDGDDLESRFRIFLDKKAKTSGLESLANIIELRDEFLADNVAK